MSPYPYQQAALLFQQADLLLLVIDQFPLQANLHSQQAILLSKMDRFFPGCHAFTLHVARFFGKSLADLGSYNIFFFRDAALRAYQGVMTLPRFCGDRKHKSDGIRVAKAEPLSASFSTTSARKRDSFASILNEGCTRPKRWLPCRQNGDVAHIYQILPCAKASLLIQYWRNCAATCS